MELIHSYFVAASDKIDMWWKKSPSILAESRKKMQLTPFQWKKFEKIEPTCLKMASESLSEREREI